MKHTTPFIAAGLVLATCAVASLRPAAAAQDPAAQPAAQPVVEPHDPTSVPASQPARRFRLAYKLADGHENWPADKRAAIVAAMDAAVALYNDVGEFDKLVTAAYSPGTPTADANYDGWIRFGGQIGTRTALHEIGHTLGVGTVRQWRERLVDGKWTGPHAIAQLQAFDGPDAVLRGDRQHFWPYGLNFDRESSPENDRRHVLMVAALRKDMGIENGVELPRERRQRPTSRTTTTTTPATGATTQPELLTP